LIGLVVRTFRYESRGGAHLLTEIVCTGRPTRLFCSEVTPANPNHPSDAAILRRADAIGERGPQLHAAPEISPMPPLCVEHMGSPLERFQRLGQHLSVLVKRSKVRNSSSPRKSKKSLPPLPLGPILMWPTFRRTQAKPKCSPPSCSFLQQGGWDLISRCVAPPPPTFWAGPRALKNKNRQRGAPEKLQDTPLS